MAKTIHFVSGLPRSGSTLLMNLLAQHPKVHSTATSGLHEIGYIARQFSTTEEFKTIPNPRDGEKLFYDYVKGGCENAFNRLTDRPIVADKCRSWIGHLDMLFAIWPNAKILVPLRDMRGILSSFEKKWRQHPFPFTAIERQTPQNWTTVEKRAQGWLNIPPLGIAVERLSDAVKRYKNKLHFVHFESLTESSQETMNEIWEYLQLQAPKHDFNYVEQYTYEHELGWPYGDHTIKHKVTALDRDWDAILGREFCDQIYQNFKWINDLRN